MINFNHKSRKAQGKYALRVWRPSLSLVAMGLSVVGLLAGIPLSSFAQTSMPVATPAPQTAQTFTFGKPIKGVTGLSVKAATPYDPALGYGFVSIPNGNEEAFSVKTPPGDYAVTVTLGDDAAASRTSIWAEDRRLMAAPQALKKGEVRKVTFRVNVRDARLVVSEQDATPSPGVGLRGDEASGRTWDDQLTISVSGSAPALRAIEIAPVASRRVLIAGDSTVTDQAGTDYASWGQMLPRFLSADVSVANHARSGETMKSFLTSLRWDKLMSETRPGDIVLIQFAHNDEKKQWPRTYAAADQAYPAFLTALVADVRQHGAQAVLVTPVARRSFGKDGIIENTHGGYPAAVRNVAAVLKTPLIDLTQKTTRMYEALGPDVSPLAFGNQGKDKTHHNAYGAYMIACFVAQDLTGFGDLNLKAAPDLPGCAPEHPDDPRKFALEPTDWPIMRAGVTQGAEPPVKK